MTSTQSTGTLGVTGANGLPLSVQFKTCGDPAALAVTAAAAMAVLVADGATPTQAHVTAMNTAYSALAATQGGDINIAVNLANVTTLNQLRAALRAYEQVAAGSGYFT